MLNKQIEKYLSTASGLPFFYSVSEEEYMDALSLLKQAGVEAINISDFCKNNDKNPSLSDVVDFSGLQMWIIKQTDMFFLGWGTIWPCVEKKRPYLC